MQSNHNQRPKSVCREIADKAAALAVLADMNGRPDLADQLRAAAEEADRIAAADSPLLSPAL